MAADDNSVDPLIGQTLAGRYRVVSHLRSGGMGVTYRAWYQAGGVPVVIKMPHKQLLADPTFVERFLREISLLQRMFHPHIVPIIDVGTHDDTPFVAMRFLPGGSLSNRRLQDRNGGLRPNPTTALHHWLPAMADALDYVHAEGVVHRDVKPANIFFDAFWGSYLGDFGIAKVVAESGTFDKEHTLTATNMGIGTQGYMSPEQFTPKARVDGRADQYALAVTAYEMLAGRRPFTGDSAHIIVEVTTQPVPPLTSFRNDLPQSLVDAVHRGLAKHPADRFTTCAEFAAAALGDVPPPDDDPSMARLLCPGCVTILKLTVDHAGRLGSCPRCSAAIIVAPDLTALWLRHEATAASIKLTPRPPRKPGDSGDQHDDGTGEATPPRASAESTEQHEQDREGPRRTRISSELRSLTRACVVTALAMALTTVALALFVTPPPEMPERRYLYFSIDGADDFEVFEDEGPFENTQQTEAIDMAVFADAPVESLDVVNLSMHGYGHALSPSSDRSATTKSPGPVELLPPVNRLSLARPWVTKYDNGIFTGRTNITERDLKDGATLGTEEAVKEALAWLVEHQLDDGSWSFNLNDCPKCKGSCSHSGRCEDKAGATAMALLPFLGRGYTQRGAKYAKQIERGMEFLAAQVAQNGIVYSPQGAHGLYVQGLAGMALSECYGMTRDQRFGKPAQLVLDHIMAAQDPRGGGWRYRPGQPGDTSATSWQIMALATGRKANLRVDPVTLQKGSDFLDSVQSDRGAAYGYTDNTTKQPALSAVGLLCRMYLGWRKDDPALRDGVARLLKTGPTDDLYHDYFATEIMRHVEGDTWRAWDDKMRPMLMKAQATTGHEKGSWYEGVAGNAEAVNQGGRLYCTCMATMICEIYYRRLPMYRIPLRDEEFKE